MKRITRWVAVLAGLAALATPAAAYAAAPTRISDTFRSVICAGLGPAGEDLVFLVASSSEGTVAVVQAATSTGESLGDGFGTSDWTATGVRSAVEVLDDEGRSVGTATLHAGLSLRDDAQRVTSKFKDGNIRVVEDHTTTTYDVRDVVMTFRGEPVDVTSCDGSQVVGSLFFTSPASYVARDGDTVVESCAFDNANGLSFEGNLRELAVTFDYADRPEVSAASPGITFVDGRWTGAFRLFSEEGPLGEVAASATLTQAGDTVKVGGPTGGGGFERFRITPYTLVITADGPQSPATITCTLLDVAIAFHAVSPR